MCGGIEIPRDDCQWRPGGKNVKVQKSFQIFFSVKVLETWQTDVMETSWQLELVEVDSTVIVQVYRIHLPFQ